MTREATNAPARLAKSTGNARIVRMALREMRGGLSGFYVFVACIALGVAVIAGVGALSDALRAGFEKQGEVLLGGDVALARSHRRVETSERDWMMAHGRLSETATLRAMGRRLDGNEQVLIELKGIDAAYPLAGQLELKSNGLSRDAVFEGRGAAVDEILLEQLQVKLGDKIQLGHEQVQIRATIVTEPDKISDRMTFGPRVMVSLATLDATGLAEPGSLVRWRYAFRLPVEATAQALADFRSAARAVFPDAGFSVADRRDPSPQVTKTLDRLRQFLTLIGLTSLLVGGVGVANAVATYVDKRRKVIATFKSLGASGRQIFILHLVQILLIAALGIVIGLGLGLLVPLGLNWLLGDALPVRPEFAIRPRSLAIATAYGALVALLFTLWPLGRADEVRASVLFRDEIRPAHVLPRLSIIAATVCVGAALLALALATSESTRIAFYFCAALAGIFLLFILLGLALTWAVRRIPRPRWPELALALGSLGAPGGLTRSVVLSLGTGLSLLVAVALADASIVAELQSRLPRNSPNFFVLDIPKGDIDGFKELVRTASPQAHVNQAPMLRGRIVRLGGKSAEQIKASPEAQWVLTGDRGLTYSEEVPEGSSVVKGQWWPQDYNGEPLVSFEAELARQLGVDINDEVTVNVLGRNITARIANLRDVRWESLAINFVMVFSPNTLRAAPHNLLATITLPPAISLTDEASLARQIGKAYPAVTAIRVKDAINSFNTVFSKIMRAVRVAGSVTLLAGAMVLAGAMATAQRRRIMQAVILKTIGGTRRRILTIHALEYAILAAVTTGLAVVLGAIAAYASVRRVIDVPFVFSWPAVGQALGVSLALVFLLGLSSTWRVLQARPVPYLRTE